MSKIKFIFISFVLTLSAYGSVLYAHPGHGDTPGHSLIHYLTEPMHVMVFAAVVIMIAGSFTWYLIQKKKKAAERA